MLWRRSVRNGRVRHAAFGIQSSGLGCLPGRTVHHAGCPLPLHRKTLCVRSVGQLGLVPACTSTCWWRRAGRGVLGGIPERQPTLQTSRKGQGPIVCRTRNFLHRRFSCGSVCGLLLVCTGCDGRYCAWLGCRAHVLGWMRTWKGDAGRDSAGASSLHFELWRCLRVWYIVILWLVSFDDRRSLRCRGGSRIQRHPR